MRRYGQCPGARGRSLLPVAEDLGRRASQRRKEEDPTLGEEELWGFSFGMLLSGSDVVTLKALHVGLALVASFDNGGSSPLPL